MTVSTTPGAAYASDAGDARPDNLLLSNTGPASYAERSHHPDLTVHGEPKVVPIRVARNFYIEPRDPDPRGMRVVGADDVVGGTVVDVWVDRSEPAARYLEASVPGRERTVLVPINVCKVKPRDGVVFVNAILGAQFADVPVTANPDQVSLREEDQIMAYFAGGYMYATPRRARPLL